MHRGGEVNVSFLIYQPKEPRKMLFLKANISKVCLKK